MANTHSTGDSLSTRNRLLPLLLLHLPFEIRYMIYSTVLNSEYAIIISPNGKYR
jgi:hypothetical protein